MYVPGEHTLQHNNKYKLKLQKKDSGFSSHTLKHKYVLITKEINYLQMTILQMD